MTDTFLFEDIDQHCIFIYIYIYIYISDLFSFSGCFCCCRNSNLNGFTTSKCGCMLYRQTDINSRRVAILHLRNQL